MVYNGIQQVVIRTIDGLVLRYGHCDFASQNDFDSNTESVIESDYRFEQNPRRHKYNWNGSSIVDNGQYIIRTISGILDDIEEACTVQQWSAIENWIDNHYMFIYKLRKKNYISARSRIQAAYDAAQIPQAIYDIIMAAIPTEDPA